MPARFKSFTGELNADAYEVLAMRQAVAKEMQALYFTIEAEQKRKAEEAKAQANQPKS